MSSDGTTTVDRGWPEGSGLPGTELHGLRVVGGAGTHLPDPEGAAVCGVQADQVGVHLTTAEQRNAVLDELEPRFASIDRRPIGQGKEAMVYAAVSSDGHERVIRVDKTADRTYDDLQLTGLSSPVLTRVLEVGSLGGVGFQVMERIHGTSIDEHVRVHGPYPREQVVAFVEQIVEGLAELASGPRRVHFDISDTNVLHVASGDDHRPSWKVIDYGLMDVMQHTVLKAIRGWNPLFGPPEGHRSPQTRSVDWDFWSLGMLVALMVTGRHLLDVSSEESLSRVVNDHLFELDVIEDDRLRLLIAGLLTVPFEHRWNVRQIREWLGGGSPPVFDHGGLRTTPLALPAVGAPAVVPLRFAGLEFHSDPRRLADALGLHWADAAEALGSRESRAQLLAWTAQFNDAGLTAAIDGAGSSDTPLDHAIIRVIAHLYRLPRQGSAGQGRLWFHGERLTEASLADWCAAARAASAQLRDTTGRAADLPLEADEDLVRCVRLVEGDLGVLAASDSRIGWLRSLLPRFEAGSAEIVDGTRDLAPEAAPWEETLWAIRLLEALVDPLVARRAAATARSSARHRHDLRYLAGPAATPAQLLVAEVRSTRTTERRGLRWWVDEIRQWASEVSR